MAEDLNQIRGSTQIQPQTVDKTRLTGVGEVTGYVLKVQGDGSLDFESISTSDILDFDITSPQEGDRLAYNFITGKWENRPMIYDSDLRAYLLN
jgi:hypothetical protein